MNITGFLELGNGEKCPWCNHFTVTKDNDSLSHVINEHPFELDKMLFPDTVKEKS